MYAANTTGAAVQDAGLYLPGERARPAPPAEPARDAAAAGPVRITFAADDDGFYQELKRRVGEALAAAGLASRDPGPMLRKSAILVTWLVASYALLVFAAATWWQAALLCLSLALAAAGIGFAVQHDANHGASSGSPALNRALGFTLDLLGGSSYVWRWKHNIFHHTYPNLTGADDDIDLGPLARLAPDQPLRAAHRWQHLYLWVLYGFLAPKWHFLDDFKNIARGKIGGRPFPRPRGLELFEAIAGKVIFVGWALVIPMLLHPVWAVLLAYAATAFVLGLTLAVVFQLAHCVEEADFPSTPEGGKIVESWAAHQVRTTVDFARSNRVATWYLGGLNFQVEHHLFPKVCHVHYPRIAAIVEQTSAEYGVTYRAHEGLGGALASHWRWLRRMGRPSAPPAAASCAADAQ